MILSIEDRNLALAAWGFTIPTPSLCDTCTECGFMGPGGTASFGGHTYMQRYCSHPEFHCAIHGGGKQECAGYDPRPTS